MNLYPFLIASLLVGCGPAFGSGGTLQVSAPEHEAASQNDSGVDPPDPEAAAGDALVAEEPPEAGQDAGADLREAAAPELDAAPKGDHEVDAALEACSTGPILFLVQPATGTSQSYPTPSECRCNYTCACLIAASRSADFPPNLICANGVAQCEPGQLSDLTLVCQ